MGDGREKDDLNELWKRLSGRTEGASEIKRGVN